MKVHTQEIFKRNFQFILFVIMSVLFVITTLVNIRTISKANHPLIIGIDQNGTRIVTEANDPIYKTEASAYIQKFLFHIYNFDSENFMKRMGLITTMMSDELWKKKRSEILELKNRVEKNEIKISGQILKITLDENGIYHASVLVSEKNRLNMQTHNVAAIIKLKQINRTQENPSGLEVDSYEESITRD
ncbi:MAG: hypothetical protein BroJett040_07990 [Oligoflexia bacterium]|nr:MAG: hypothetical protein BroJett040_07990 [Oligoflexia bacterium]